MKKLWFCMLIGILLFWGFRTRGFLIRVPTFPGSTVDPPRVHWSLWLGIVCCSTRNKKEMHCKVYMPIREFRRALVSYVGWLLGDPSHKKNAILQPCSATLSQACTPNMTPICALSLCRATSTCPKMSRWRSKFNVDSSRDGTPSPRATLAPVPVLAAVAASTASDVVGQGREASRKSKGCSEGLDKGRTFGVTVACKIFKVFSSDSAVLSETTQIARYSSMRFEGTL